MELVATTITGYQTVPSMLDRIVGQALIFGGPKGLVFRWRDFSKDRRCLGPSFDLDEPEVFWNWKPGLRLV